MSSMLRVRMALPSLATMGSLALGITAITVMYEGHFTAAALLILAGACLDVLDGHLAQRFDAFTDIGKQLDSLADMVTFGVAPTLLLYNLMIVVGLHPLVALVSSIVFALGGAFRLARFNMQVSDRSAFFTGMPIPMGAILLIAGSFSQHWLLSVWWTVGVAAVSYLMVSNIPYPKLRHLLLAWPLVLLVALPVLLGAWWMATWQAVPFALLLAYTLLGPTLSLRTPRSNERLP
ncbi:MAG: CDP-diacylglycerol--serine O-phosphatidyltransferase [Caldilineaceae bacterium]|nr:CDP-diacylglycerol--serine O-phosphatidyltransferase [Caldilineaceae bacterium]